VSEVIGTFFLIIGLLFIGANAFSEGLNSLFVGLLIVVIGMSLGCATGYAINTARDLGARIAHGLLLIPGKGGSEWAYSWVPVFGPIVGGIYDAVFYNSVFNNDYTILFWILSIVVALIMLTAVSRELKLGKEASQS